MQSISENLFEPVAVRPRAITAELLLTTTTPVSHHDPAVQDDSNTMLFNRQKQLLQMEMDTAMPRQAEIDALCAAYPMPTEVADVLCDVTVPEFVAIVLTRIFLDCYNAGDGTGLLRGTNRYEMLETRLRAAAIKSHGLRGWWNRLAQDMQAPIHGGEEDAALMRLLTLPRGLQALVLRALVHDYRSIVALARFWHTQGKLLSYEYAEAAGKEQIMETKTLRLAISESAGGSQSAAIVDVPAVSSNTLRHQVVREPGWLHLAGLLGLSETQPGQGEITPGAEAIFVNGGNIRAGAKQPSNPFGLAQQIRGLYPLLDLLGGVTDSFDLGESRLSVASWLVCRENRAALAGSPAADLPTASLSVFDMIDDVTLTRQATERGVGQMIYSFETLCTGVQILCRLSLAPFTSGLTQGAMAAAATTYLANLPNLAGQSARGYGHLTGEWLVDIEQTGELIQAYEEYIRSNIGQLRAGLVDGTMGTGTVVVS